MFRTPTVEDVARELPVRKLLHLVLLMATRDQAKCVRFEPTGTLLHMWYLCPNETGPPTWFELVPVPRANWEPLVAVFRESCELQPLGGPSDDRGTLGRLGGWFAKKPSAQDSQPYYGPFVQEIGTYRREWSLLLDTRRGIPSAVVIPTDERPSVERAGQLLAKVFKADDLLGL